MVRKWKHKKLGSTSPLDWTEKIIVGITIGNVKIEKVDRYKNKKGKEGQNSIIFGFGTYYYEQEKRKYLLVFDQHTMLFRWHKFATYKECIAYSHKLLKYPEITSF